MRVIAGTFRSRKLNEFKNSSTRPTLDRVKEAIFSKIHTYLDGKVVLDLFSGTGALGIEAISRGAKDVYFVDKNLTAINLIKKNLTMLNQPINNVFFSSFDLILAKFKKDNLKFDIVLLDPPFNNNLGYKAIEMLLELSLLNEDAIIVYECEENLIEKSFLGLSECEIKKYGTVKVLYYRKLSSSDCLQAFDFS